MKTSLGVTTPYHGSELTVSSLTSEGEKSTEEIHDSIMDGTIDSDQFMSSAAHARPRRTVTAEKLSKLWRIDLPTARRTLEVTSQHSA